jgi:TolB protein
MRSLGIAFLALMVLAASASARRAQVQDADRIANGRLAYSLSDLGEIDGFATLVVSDPNGARKKTILEGTEGAGVYSEPDWSPDGTKIAVTYTVGSRYTGYSSEIWLANADGTGLHRPVVEPSASRSSPSWSPDGTKLAFDQTTGEIYVVGADGSGKRPLTTGFAPAWSPDGTKIVFVRNAGGDDTDLYVIGADGSGLTRLTSGTLQDREPDWSPDGQQIVFEHGRPGFSSIYVVAPDGTGLRLLSRYGLSPAWSPDGTKIVFARNGDLWVLSRSGGRARNITRTRSISKDEGTPDWQPVRVVSGTMLGTPFADYLAGGPGKDVIHGGAGNDLIAGGHGRDVLDGGPGNDTFYAQDGQRDVIDGGPGRDRAFVDKRLDSVRSVERKYSRGG